MTGRYEADPGPFLRPYAMTEGRTEPTGPDLAIEDLIGAASATDPPPWLSLEHRSIALACREILSVAELAARVDLPLGSPGCWSATWPPTAWSPSTGPPATPEAPTSPCSSRSCTASRSCSRRQAGSASPACSIAASIRSTGPSMALAVARAARRWRSGGWGSLIR